MSVLITFRANYGNRVHLQAVFITTVPAREKKYTANTEQKGACRSKSSFAQNSLKRVASKARVDHFRQSVDSI